MIVITKPFELTEFKLSGNFLIGYHFWRTLYEISITREHKDCQFDIDILFN